MSTFIYLNNFFSQLWKETNPFDAVEKLAGEEFRRVKTRRTFRVEFGGKGFFVKHHLGVGWREIIKNLLVFKSPVVSALNEFNALRRLHELDVPTMTEAACGCRGKNPAKLESFLITEELKDMIDLEQLCAGWKDNPPALSLRRSILDAVASSTGKMHRGGINHRDCYICHYMTPQSGEDAGKKVFVIDLHRAQIRKRVPRRYLVKDLGGLCFSAMDNGLSMHDALRFIRIYSGQSLKKEFATNGELWKDVLVCARRLYHKEFNREAPVLR